MFNTLTIDDTIKKMCVVLGVIAIKEYYTLPRSQELEPQYQMYFSVIAKTILIVIYHVF